MSGTRRRAIRLLRRRECLERLAGGLHFLDHHRQHPELPARYPRTRSSGGPSRREVSADFEPPLDFAVAEADIVDAGAAHDVQIGTLGDVRAVAAR